jgi:hypothetical protein
MLPKMRAAREFRVRISSTLASALSKLSSSSPGKSEESLAAVAEFGRTIMDTGSDGCGSTGGDGVAILSAVGFAGDAVLPTVAVFTVAVDFCGTGLCVGFDEVSVLAGGRGAAGVASKARSSVGCAVSTTADGAVSVVPSVPLAVDSETDFSEEVVNG